MKQMDKAIKAGRLAISAEQIGSELECEQAARTCGRLAACAGVSLDALFVQLAPSALAWNSMVDGWYAESEAN